MGPARSWLGLAFLGGCMGGSDMAGLLTEGHDWREGGSVNLTG